MKTAKRFFSGRISLIALGIVMMLAGTYLFVHLLCGHAPVIRGAKLGLRGDGFFWVTFMDVPNGITDRGEFFPPIYEEIPGCVVDTATITHISEDPRGSLAAKRGIDFFKDKYVDVSWATASPTNLKSQEGLTETAFNGGEHAPHCVYLAIRPMDSTLRGVIIESPAFGWPRHIAKTLASEGTFFLGIFMICLGGANSSVHRAAKRARREEKEHTAALLKQKRGRGW